MRRNSERQNIDAFRVWDEWQLNNDEPLTKYLGTTSHLCIVSLTRNIVATVSNMFLLVIVFCSINNAGKRKRLLDLQSGF